VKKKNEMGKVRVKLKTISIAAATHNHETTPFE